MLYYVFVNVKGYHYELITAVPNLARAKAIVKDYPKSNPEYKDRGFMIFSKVL